MIWHHPKYYKELAKKRKEFERQQAIDETVPHCDIEEAASAKLQASSFKHQASQDAGDKPQAPSSKDQASSRKRQAP